MLRDVVPDIAAVITPTKFMKEAVIACAEAGVKGVSTDKPIAAKLADADAMVDACRKRDVVFAGGNLQRAMWEVQQAAVRLRAGDYGQLQGAVVHRFGGEISGGGCQHCSVLRLLTGAEVNEVVAWGQPAEALQGDTDEGLEINGVFRMSTGIDCQPHLRTEALDASYEILSRVPVDNDDTDVGCPIATDLRIGHGPHRLRHHSLVSRCPIVSPRTTDPCTVRHSADPGAPLEYHSEFMLR